MTCLRFPARAPIAADDAASGNTELVSHGPDRPIRLLVADDDARVRAAIGQTISLAAGAVAFAEKDDIDAILDAVRAAAPPHCA